MLAGLSAQAIKPFLNKRFYSSLEIAGRQVPRYGGMPSSHSAFTASLATLAFVVDGADSITFAIAMAIFILTIDDALRMRIFLGSYGRVLKQLVDTIPNAEQQKFPYIETRLGHKPLEVLAGIFQGIVVTLLVLYLI